MSYLEKASQMMPYIYTKKVYPLSYSEPEENFMGKGDSFILDFGTHLVGYLHMNVSANRTPDSPLRLIFHFAEMPFELDNYEYSGGLSSTWIQKEIVNVDNPLEKIVSAALKPDGSVEPSYYFIDWCPELDKTAAAQGILVEMLKKQDF